MYAQSAASTDVILDIDGYFLPATSASLQFFPLTPCRLVDTRNTAGPLGGPYIPAGQTRSFPVQSGTCQLPANAKAYSLNVTAIPAGLLNYMTVWPTGQTQPNSSILNSLTGTVVANAAILPSGNAGAVSVFSSNDADVLLDVNGYFAAPAAGGLSLYNPASLAESLIPGNSLIRPFPGSTT